MDITTRANMLLQEAYNKFLEKPPAETNTVTEKPATSTANNSGDTIIISQKPETTGDINETKEEAVPTEESKEGEETAISNYEESITLTEGVKTNYSLTYGDKIYYYPNISEKANAEILEDPSTTAVGKGEVQQQWGKRTKYFIVADGSKWYFDSIADYSKAQLLTTDAMKALAVGRFPAEYTGGEEVQNNDDAIADLQGQKSSYYRDIKGTRYYYSSIIDLCNASTSISLGNTCGQAEIMTKWGISTDYYIDYDGVRYYFANEDDKKQARKYLSKNGVTSRLQYNNLLVGKGEIPISNDILMQDKKIKYKS